MIQRYEGASTIFGPNTLQAYQKVLDQLSKSFKDPQHLLPTGAPEVSAREVSLVSPVVLDMASKGFGAVVKDVEVGKVVVLKREKSLNGEEGKVVKGFGHSESLTPVVSAEFECAHPRNGGFFDPKTGLETFMEVQVKKTKNGVGKAEEGKKVDDSAWETFLTDEVWDTKYMWRRYGLMGSRCIVSWSVGRTMEVPPGEYRLKVYGRYKTGWLGMRDFEGVSSLFVVR
jgi:neutral ceramidase